MDPELLGRLLDRHAAALELYARQWCDVAEDVVQDAFLKLAAQEPLPSHPGAWLFRVVRNGANNARLAAQRRRRHETAAAAEMPAWFEASPSAQHGVAIEPDSAAAELRALPIEEREVIVAHLWGGLTFEQIAELAGCSSSTAHRLYQSGLTTLRERLGVTCHTSKSRTIPS
jgi:RNA polymerase sigma factor (sigma-70 family)